jgi:hypothetical protein
MKTEGIFHDRAKPVLEVETDTAYQSVRTTRRLSPCGGGADRSLKILAHLHMLLFRSHQCDPSYGCPTTPTACGNARARHHQRMTAFLVDDLDSTSAILPVRTDQGTELPIWVLTCRAFRRPRAKLTRLEMRAADGTQMLYLTDEARFHQKLPFLTRRAAASPTELRVGWRTYY